MSRTNDHPRCRLCTGCRGFTLVESMASIVVLAVLGSIASFLVLNSVDNYADAATAAQLHAELSVAMDRVARELRKIELDSGAATPPAPDINNVTATSMQWDDSGGDSYQVQYAAGVLNLQENGGPLAVLLSDVTACTIATYDEDNTALAATLAGAACDPIRRVQIDVTITRNGVSESLRTKVYIRSCMDGSQ